MPTQWKGYEVLVLLQKLLRLLRPLERVSETPGVHRTYFEIHWLWFTKYVPIHIVFGSHRSPWRALLGYPFVRRRKSSLWEINCLVPGFREAGRRGSITMSLLPWISGGNQDGKCSISISTHLLILSVGPDFGGKEDAQTHWYVWGSPIFGEEASSFVGWLRRKPSVKWTLLSPFWAPDL